MQPTPKVNHLDVERVVRRDFPASRVQDVLSMLETYGTADYHREKDRVRLAVLKLSNGSLENLARELEIAKRDYRDSLAYAEYPAYMRTTPANDKISSNERKMIIDADSRQYDDWLKRG